MSDVRFASARALFETFPQAVAEVGAEPTDESPIEFLRRLGAQNMLPNAIAFCAYLLPRREAVWWACGCVRTMLGQKLNGNSPALLAAEAWVHDPGSEQREHALKIGQAGDNNDPLTWLALGAGWAGGSFFYHPEHPAPIPQYMTARAARVAVILASISLKTEERPDRFRACVDEAIKLAESAS